jgi:hypothetical protein
VPYFGQGFNAVQKIDSGMSKVWMYEWGLERFKVKRNTVNMLLLV